MSVSYDTARARTAPRRPLPALPSDPAGLLAAAHKADTERRTRAVLEFTRYTLAPSSVLVKSDGSGSYEPLQFAARPRFGDWHSGCSCPDHKRHVTPLLDALQAASVGTACRCKHSYIRHLLQGLPVRIGNRVFRAKAQFVVPASPTISTMTA